MDPFLQSLSELPNLVADYKAIANRLIEAERELAALKSEKFVPISWFAELWDVDPDTARKMITMLSAGRRSASEIKVLSFGAAIVRYRRSDILRITEANLRPVKEMLAQKRANKAKLN